MESDYDSTNTSRLRIWTTTFTDVNYMLRRNENYLVPVEGYKFGTLFIHADYWYNEIDELYNDDAVQLCWLSVALMLVRYRMRS